MGGEGVCNQSGSHRGEWMGGFRDAIWEGGHRGRSRRAAFCSAQAWPVATASVKLDLQLGAAATTALGPALRTCRKMLPGRLGVKWGPRAQDQTCQAWAPSCRAQGPAHHRGQLEQWAPPQDTCPNVSPAHLHMVPGEAKAASLPRVPWSLTLRLLFAPNQMRNPRSPLGVGSSAVWQPRI